MNGTTIGLYSPGSSALHRMSAGGKLAGMLVAVVAVALLTQWWQLSIAAVIVGAGYAAARIPVRTAWAQLSALKYLIPILAVLQVWLAGWPTAVRVCGVIVLAVAIAALVTLTTRVSQMLDALLVVLRPLRLLRVDTDRIALLLAVTIRCIPLVAGIVNTVTEARKARGLGFSVVALGAPVMIRSLRAADALGDALIARGADD